MLGPKEAIKIAREYLLDIYEGRELRNLLLEEVQRSEDEQYWQITFGFDTDSPTVENATVFSMNVNNRPQYVRAYKRINVDADSGVVESMLIRE